MRGRKTHRLVAFGRHLGVGRSGRMKTMRDTLPDQAGHGGAQEAKREGPYDRSAPMTEAAMMKQWLAVHTAWGDDFEAYRRHVGLPREEKDEAQ